MTKYVLMILAWCGSLAAQEAGPRSLAYVLQAEGLGKARAEVVERLAGCGRDWIVLDRAFGEGKGGAWTPEEIGAIRAGKEGRKVVVYLSIGEAEDYRGYWKRGWDADRDGRPDKGAPSWLCAENPDWEGNYKVRYWDPAWQEIVLDDLRTAMRSGFDGVYMDLVDAFETFEYDPEKKDWVDDRKNPETGKTYRGDMIAWVGRIAEAGRKERPGFLVIPQNGVQLLEDAGFTGLIDGMGVEDLFTNGNRPQKPREVDYRLGFVRKLRMAGKPVLVIEYGTQPQAAERSAQGATQEGLVLLVTDRQLKTLGKSGE